MRCSRTSLILLAVLLVLAAARTALADDAAEPVCPLVPVPKSYRDHGRTWQLLGPEQTAIVLGAQAAAPERYAAERLQTSPGRTRCSTCGWSFTIAGRSTPRATCVQRSSEPP